MWFCLKYPRFARYLQVKNRSDEFFLHLTCVVNAHIGLLCCAFRHCVTHKNNLIIDDFGIVKTKS